MKTVNTHFSGIAHKYRDLRTTDLEPILFIWKKLGKKSRVAADFGCGAGRYDLKLFQYLGKKLFLYCIDANKEMLKHLKEHLVKKKIKNFKTIEKYAKKVPIKDNSLDNIFTFNAVHHFKLPEFLKESSRILKDDGYLFIYTRLRSQNRRNIWGRNFPLFNKKEDRLHTLDEFKNSVRKTYGLKIDSTEYFKYSRIASLDWLINQAKNYHYSTFQLYSKKEFELALEKFKQNIHKKFKDLKKINWFDENILLVIKRSKRKKLSKFP